MDSFAEMVTVSLMMFFYRLAAELTAGVITGCPAARLMSWTLTITIVVLGTHVEASDKVQIPVFTDTPKSRIGLVTKFLKPLEKCLGSVWYFVHISPV